MPAAGGPLTEARQSQLVSLSREILITEMLTRVWSTVLTATDRQQHTTRAAATATNTYLGHLEARNEVLQLIVDDEALPAAEQASLERFRRRTERWTDALLGPLLADYGVDDYAFDADRAHDFSTSALQQKLSGTAKAQFPLLMAGISSAFPGESDADRERSLLNRTIVRSILSAYPEELITDRDGGTAEVARRAHASGVQSESVLPSAEQTRDASAGSTQRRLSFADIRSRNSHGTSPSY
jgi:hypothetical protein